MTKPKPITRADVKAKLDALVAAVDESTGPGDFNVGIADAAREFVAAHREWERRNKR